MPKCVICAKGPQVGNNVSHSNNHTKRRWLPNLQTVRAHWEGKVQNVTICASCLRSGKIVKAARRLRAIAKPASKASV